MIEQSYKTLKRILDDTFSEFIRLRDTQEGWGICISCGKPTLYDKGDCGHYIGRGCLALRWSEKNCAFQCRDCNRFKEGNKIGFKKGLIKKHGENVVPLLEIQQKSNVKYGRFELRTMIDYYKGEILQMKGKRQRPDNAKALRG